MQLAKLTSDSQSAIDRMLDIFAGADGGIGFVKFRMWLLETEKKDDPASKQLVQLVHRFSTLLRVVTK